MPVDNTINSTDKFDFKNQIKIVNAVVASYIGHPMGVAGCMQPVESIHNGA